MSFYAIFIEPFVAFDFMRRALIGSVALALGAAPVGVFLTLRRMSLTGDAMAHAVLPGAALGFMFAGLAVIPMTIGGIVAGSLVALASLWAARSSATSEDVNMAAFYLISMALGVLLITQNGSAVDLMHVLFGSALALDNAALYLLSTVASISLLVGALIYRPLVVMSFDGDFLSTERAPYSVVYYVFLVLVVLNLVGGFHAMGTMMAVGVLILPAAIARLWSVTLEYIILIALLIAIVACYLGLVVSYLLPSPTSSVIILTLGCAYIFSLLFAKERGILFIKLRRAQRHLQN